VARRPAIHLTDEERERLLELTQDGRTDQRTLVRARILLMSDDGVTDAQIARTLHVGTTTIRGVRKQFNAGGLDAVIGPPPPHDGPTGRKGGQPACDEPSTTSGASPGSPAGEEAPRQGSFPGAICGTQWTGTVAANAERQWFTLHWPATWHVVWTVVPVTVSVRLASPQVTWQVTVQRATPEHVTYWIRVTNLTTAAITIEGRYAILGKC